MAANVGGVSIPTNPADLLSQGLNFANRFQKSGIFTKAVAYAGKPMAWDLSKSDGALYEKHKDECKGPLFYIKKFVLTWGNVIGAAGLFLSGLIGRFIPSGEEGGGKAKGAIVSLLSLGGLLGIGASIWGTVSGKTIDEFVKGPERDAKIGSELLKVVEKSLTTEQKTELETFFLDKEINPLRYNDGDQKFIDGYLNHPEKPALGLFVGKSGTGKTKAMEWITAKIINHEKANNKEVEVWQISGQALQEIINGKIKEGENRVGLINEALSLASGFTGVDPNMAQGVLNQLRQDKIKLLRGVLYNIKQKFEEAKASTPPKRLIVQIDEIDNLFDVAKEGGVYNEDFVNDISGLLGELFEQGKGYDILMTSNRTVDELCGLGTNFKTLEELERSKLAKAYGRLNQPTVCHTFEIPNVETSPKIFGVYAKKNSNEFDSQFITNNETDNVEKIKTSLNELFPPFTHIHFNECVSYEDVEKKLNQYLLRLALEKLEGRGIEGIISSLIKEKQKNEKITHKIFLEKITDYLIKERVPKLEKSDPVYIDINNTYNSQRTYIRQSIEEESRRKYTEERTNRSAAAQTAELESKAPNAARLLTALKDVTEEQLTRFTSGEGKIEDLSNFVESISSGKALNMAATDIKARLYLVQLGLAA